MELKPGTALHSVMELMSDGARRTRAEIVEALREKPHSAPAIDMALLTGGRAGYLEREKVSRSYFYRKVPSRA